MYNKINDYVICKEPFYEESLYGGERYLICKKMKYYKAKIEKLYFNENKKLIFSDEIYLNSATFLCLAISSGNIINEIDLKKYKIFKKHFITSLEPHIMIEKKHF